MPTIKVDEKLIKHVADVARLELTEHEVKTFLPQMKEILKAFSELDEINVENTPPSFQPVPIKNVTRKDEPGDCLTQEEALANTEHKKDGYFKGPRAV